MIRAFALGFAGLLAAPLPASTAMLTVGVPMLPSAPIVVLGTTAGPAAPSLSVAVPLASMPSIFSASPITPSAPIASAAPALAALPAAAAPPRVPEDPNGLARPSLPFELEAARAGARFDGSAPADAPAPVAAPAAPSPPLGSGLKMARPEHEEWLASVVGLLSGTRTGRRVLRDVDALAARQRRPVLLDVAPIGNNGEFRYDSGLLIMDAGHLKRDPFQSAPILAHELQHVLQRSMNLPVDALELEIESYTVESRVWSELGVEPESGSFAIEARRRLRKGFPSFVKWLGREYKDNIPLYGSTLDAYAARLEKKRTAALKGEARTRRKLAAVERVLASMRANGMSEEAIEAHRREDLEPLERSLRDAAVNDAWLERDLRLLSDPVGRARFRAYARGVARRARALSRS